MSLREGALCEPLSVGVHVCCRGDVGPGDIVCITGAGPIGLVMMAVARAVGASDIVSADPVGRKRDLARQRGANLAVDPSDTDLATAVHDHAGGGANVVIEASGAQPAIQSTLDAVRRCGSIVLVGLAAEAEVPLDVLDPAAIDLLADDAVMWKDSSTSNPRSGTSPTRSNERRIPRR